MAHAPIYRASEHHKPAAVLPLRRSASILSAAAALTLSGIALGYHGLSDVSVDVPQAPPSINADIAIPVPGLAFPAVDGGHPDLLAQLSTSLLAHIQPAPVFAAPPPLAVPPPAPLVVDPSMVPTVLAVDIAPEEGPSPTDVTGEANLAVPQDAVVVAPRRAPVQTAARAGAPVAVAPAPTDDVEIAAAVVTAEPSAPLPTPVPVKTPVAVREPTVAPKPVVPVVREPTPEPKRAEVKTEPQPERKAAPPPEPPKAQANNARQDDGKKDDPKPQANPPHKDNKSAPNKGKGKD